MKIFRLLFSALTIIFTSGVLIAQQPTSSIRGRVLDADSESPVGFATVTIPGTDPQIGVFTDDDGKFEIKDIPVGRYELHAVMLGYEPAVLSGVLVISGKVQYVEIKMKEAVHEMEAVVIKADNDKEKPKNTMATVSARQLSVEEANKYAGGFDDPARLVSSFAGVASDLTTNGIVIRGNAPKGLLWRMEGVEVPNPNHFGEIAGFGAGGITALSSQMLANSDFFTGAFPAEYGNALSGVFDLSMRRGNMDEHEHTVGIGTIGLDVSSEGPLHKESNASYLFNYRYSSLALVDYITPGELGINYQDLAFKIHLPTRKAGVFSLWGLGFVDHQTVRAMEDSTERKYKYQLGSGKTKIVTGMAGLSHRYFFSEDTYLKTTLAGSVNDLSSDWNMPIDPESTERYKVAEVFTGFRNLNLNSFINHKFNAGHTNRTGIIVQQLGYDLKLEEAEETGFPLQEYVKDKGVSYLVQAFSQSSFRLGENITINPGFHMQYFKLSGKISLEPRLGMSWQFKPNQSISLGYGKHSRIEKLNFYLGELMTTDGVLRPNEDLDFTKAHHLVLGYDLQLNKNTRLKIEPYYQYLYSIPVIPDSSFSFINNQYNWFINEELSNDGKGENIGIDITLERFLNKGWFYLITASIFDSRYKGGDGVWRNTVFNRQFISNVLVGKEWAVGKDKQNRISASGKFTFMRGERWTPVDRDESLVQEEIVYHDNRLYEDQGPNTYFLHATLTYRRNKKKHSSLWSLQVLNALAARNYFGYEYNLQTNNIEQDHETIVIPNLSYKIQF